MLDYFINDMTLELLKICIVTAGIFITVITYTRIAGLRSFSKMSGFDFAMTIAIGSLIATVAVAQVSFVKGLVALTVLYTTQVIIALLRRHTLMKRIIDNQPVLLVHNGKFLNDRMRETRITRADISSRLREANVNRVDDVQAVVLEPTGDMSVLHDSADLDPALLDGVKGYNSSSSDNHTRSS